MCGIAGFISKDISKVPKVGIDNMRNSILFRGKDEQSEWSDGKHAFFLHSRLSIIDLKSGHQPMWDKNKRFIIVYNGEIYNYIELRKEYEKAGASFYTNSDTEVILEGFKLKGKQICKELNGMFAFAIWDTKTKVLFLARDHLGKKPLFWCILNDIFYFASTLDAFRCLPGWDDNISMDALSIFDNMGGFPEDVTIYKKAYAMPFACYASFHLGDNHLHTERYWHMDFTKKTNSPFEVLLDEYESILTDAIKLRLRSDVPLALTFSGGVDSGTIAAITAKKLNISLKCYTIDYHTTEDPSFEVQTAEKVAKLLGLEWEHIQFDYHHELLKDLPRTYSYYDQPSNQLALVYSQRLYEVIKPFATVVLSGNASDELFTGYIGDEKIRLQDIHYSSLRKKYYWLRFLNNRLLRFLTYLSGSGKLQRWMENVQELNAIQALFNQGSVIQNQFSDYKEEIAYKIAVDRQRCGVNNFLDMAMYQKLTCSTTDSNYRLPDISGMAAQVEVRSPYLDYRMVEYAARLPHQYKIGDVHSPSLNKYLPRKYYERWVGGEIAWMRKMGMGFNLKWDESIVKEPTFHIAFINAFESLNDYGIDTKPYYEAWQKYILDKKNGIEFPFSAGKMMAGFMLGMWFNRASIKNI